MNTMVSATLRAKLISWVTQTMVMPSSANSTMTSSTSEIISGSRAEVGSSNSMMRGSMQSERAMATRCCWPPESCAGYFSACSGMCTRSRYFRAKTSASAGFILRARTGPSVRFSTTVRCGNRLNCWNTMATSRRMALIFLVFWLSSMLSTVIVPASWASSRLMQRIIVDLPEPEGPQTTTRSPLWTVRWMFFSASKSPKDFPIPAIFMIGSRPLFPMRGLPKAPLDAVSAMAACARN